MGATLSPSQSAALFDILSHHNTYAEIRDFRLPGSLKNYGPPFTHQKNTPSTSPALQSLVSKFALSLPGLKDVPPELWTVQTLSMIEGLEVANLSESYDKGFIGSRKTLATAISALLEYITRGTFGGFPNIKDASQTYDLSKAEDLENAFRDFMDGVIYGDKLEKIIEKTAQTDKLTDHEPVIQALHEFVLVNMASFMHYTIILSPKGQYLLNLLGNINKLVPYMLIRQTLKIGNVASMISAMMRVILAKLSVTSITNWIGLTTGEDQGLNLMQQIITQVLNWDIKELKTRASKIEGDANSPSKAQLQCLKDYATQPHKKQEEIRDQSQQASISIIIPILASSSLAADLSEPAHKLAFEYLAIFLSIRDRREIVRVLCHSSPDNLTTAIRTVVNAYEPIIRNMHKAVDLSDTVLDLEAFIGDMIKMAGIQPAGKDGKEIIPTVGDFVQLLKKHEYSFHKFLHQMCKNGPEMVGWYAEWAKKAAAQFRQDGLSSCSESAGAGNLTSPLQDLFANLSPVQQQTIIPILDAQSKYLNDLHASSHKRLEAVLKSPPSKNPAMVKTMAASKSRPASRAQSPAPGKQFDFPALAPPSDQGPGAYLPRWEDLLDKTPLTPLTLNGKAEQKSMSPVLGVAKPDVAPVVDALGEDFRRLLGTRGMYW